VENIVFSLYAKFNDDRLRNEKALVLRKFDNNPNNDVRGAWGPVSVSKITHISAKALYAIRTWEK